MFSLYCNSDKHGIVILVTSLKFAVHHRHELVCVEIAVQGWVDIQPARFWLSIAAAAATRFLIWFGTVVCEDRWFDLVEKMCAVQFSLAL